MEKKGILKETYKSYVYENQNIFDLSFDMLIKLIFDKYPDLLNDTILISYLYDNISNFIDINDSYKIKLLSNSLFLKKCKGKDIVNILLTINNDEDKIKILLNENVYPRIFNNHFLVFDTLKTNFNNDESYIKLLNKLPSKAKIIVLKGIENEDLVVKILKQVDTIKEMELMLILRKFNNSNNKLLFLDKLTNPQYISEIIVSTKDKNYIQKNFDILTTNYKLSFLKSLTDKEKIYYIENGFYKLELIASLNSIDLLFRYFISLKSYDEQKVIIENVKSEEIKYELFKLMHLSYDKYMEMIFYLLKIINNKNIRLELTSLLNDKGIKKAIASNEKNIKEDLTEIEINPHVDPNITFGVELECSHKLNTSYIALGTLYNNWHFKEEGTVYNGVEITSPILNYTNEDMKRLKCICDFLNENGFKTTKDCGGHIHFGFDYIESITHLQLLYYIYVNTEEILSYMFNKEGTILREGAIANAPFINENILNLYGKYIQTYADNLKSFATLLGNAQKDRYASLNIKNAFSVNKNTIELRIPNGTLEFNELNLNIILFTRIMQKSKYFSHNTNDKKLLKELLFLSKDIPIEDKKNYLLDILFDEDYELKNIFYDRFETNYHLTKEKELSKTRN